MFEKEHAIELENGQNMLVGAALGGGFESTAELKVMKYDEAMRKDPKGWEKAVKDEYGRMKKHSVFKFVKQEDVPSGATILSSTWVMKKKSNGNYRARLNG